MHRRFSCVTYAVKTHVEPALATTETPPRDNVLGGWAKLDEIDLQEEFRVPIMREFRCCFQREKPCQDVLCQTRAWKLLCLVPRNTVNLYKDELSQRVVKFQRDQWAQLIPKANECSSLPASHCGPSSNVSQLSMKKLFRDSRPPGFECPNVSMCASSESLNTENLLMWTDLRSHFQNVPLLELLASVTRGPFAREPQIHVWLSCKTPTALGRVCARKGCVCAQKVCVCTQSLCV